MANDRTPGGMGISAGLAGGQDMYGYEMIEALRTRSSEVFLRRVTLYPLLPLPGGPWLGNLQRRGCQWPPRRYYAHHPGRP